MNFKQIEYERDEHGNIKAINPDGGFLRTQSVEALLLLDILDVLKKINLALYTKARK